MAERKGTRGRATGATKGKRKPAAVIDVEPADAPRRSRPAKDADGDGDAEEREDDEQAAEAGEPGDDDGEADRGAEDVDDDFLASAAEVIDVGADDDVEAPVPAAPASRDRGGSLARRDPLAAYMSETRRYPLLTPTEEHDLAVRLLEQGDSKAARRLVEANLRLVVKIAYEYRRAHKQLLDLIQEGNIGLMQAVRKFDPYRGVKLSSYAAFWIRAYILKFILNNWRLVKIGTTQAQRKLFFNLRKEKEKLEQLGFQPTSALLADRLDVPEKEVIEMEKRLAAPEASLDAPISADDDGARSRLDFLPSDDIRPDVAVEQSQFSTLLRDKLERFADSLEGRDQTIFRERWLTDAPKTLQEIGDRYGVSRERARQLEKRLLGKLRKYLESELGTAVDIDALTRE